MGRPVVLFWVAAGGATVSIGTAWHEVFRVTGGNASLLDRLVLSIALVALVVTVFIASRILYVFSRRS